MDGITPGKNISPLSPEIDSKTEKPPIKETLGLRADGGSSAPQKPLLQRTTSISEVASRNPALMKVEKEVVSVWEQRLSKTQGSEAREELMNLPVDNRRHMLSFAAFNGMSDAARWARANGADINTGDANNATMLKMAAINKRPEMVQVALELGADPNLVSGMKHGQMTLLSSLLAYKEDRDAPFMQVLAMAKTYGAKVSNEEERGRLLSRLSEVQARDQDGYDYQELKIYLENVQVHTNQPSEKFNGTASGSPIVSEVDNHLAQALSCGDLSSNELSQFQTGEKDFYGFLLFNGFSKSLDVYLKSRPSDEVKARMESWDAEGNNFLFSALKSKAPSMISLALDNWSGDINSICPDQAGFYAYNPGATALGIALMWGVDDEVLESLISHGANPDMSCGSYPGLREEKGKSRTAYELIDDRVSLGRTQPEQAERIKSLMKKARDSYLQTS